MEYYPWWFYLLVIGVMAPIAACLEAFRTYRQGRPKEDIQRDAFNGVLFVVGVVAVFWFIQFMYNIAGT